MCQWPLCLLLFRIVPSISFSSLSLVKSSIIISQCAILYLLQIRVAWYLDVLPKTFLLSLKSLQWFPVMCQWQLSDSCQGSAETPGGSHSHLVSWFLLSPLFYWQLFLPRDPDIPTYPLKLQLLLPTSLSIPSWFLLISKFWLMWVILHVGIEKSFSSHWRFFFQLTSFLS